MYLLDKYYHAERPAAYFIFYYVDKNKACIR